MVNRMPRTNLISKRHKNAVYGVFKRGLALLLCLCVMLSMVDLAIPVVHAANAYTSVDELPYNAMHFVVRHWHTLNDDSSSRFQGTEGAGGVEGTETTKDRHFTVLEGYIVPVGTTYELYLVYQSDFVEEDSNGGGTISHSKGDIERINDTSDLNYIKSFNSADGTVTLAVIPVTNENGVEGEDERFSGISVSAGQEAVDTDGKSDGTFTISYKANIHLVKCHVFYIYEGVTVEGTSDSAVFDNSDGVQTNPEVDTAYVYAYKKDGDDYRAGDLVTYNDDNITHILSVDNPAAENILEKLGLTFADVYKVKIYSTLKGLHTDKTAYVNDYLNRIYDLELEAWFAGATPANIGLVLDASGSMAFTSDAPTPINVNDIIGVLRKSNPDAAKVLLAKIGALAAEKEAVENSITYAYPQREKMIGYYTFTGGSSGASYTLVPGSGALAVGNYQNKTSEGVGTNGFFDIVWGSNSATAVTKGTATFDDSSSFDYYINFGGDTSKSTDRVIKFTTSGKAAIKIWWSSTGADRPMKIWDTDNNVAIWTSENTTSTNKRYIHEYIVDAAGTYSIGGGKANIYKVEVTEISSSNEDPSLKNEARGNSYAMKVNRQTAGGAFLFNTNDTVSGSSPITGNELLIDNSTSTAGILLDAIPTSGSFTISFAISKNNGSGSVGLDQATRANQKLADILYIGALDSSANNGSYFRVIRNGGASAGKAGGTTERAWLTGYQGEPSDTYVSSMSAFHNADVHYVTYVFDDGRVTSYFDGQADLDYTDNTYNDVPPTTNNLALPENFRIIFNGFQDEYNGAYLHIDDVFVYDTALSGEEVTQLVTATKNGNGINDSITTYSINWNNVFLDLDTELNLILNPHNTDNSRLSSSDYTYFVYDSRDSTMEYVPLGYWDGGKTESETWVDGSGTLAYTQAGEYFASADNVAGEGWYYASYISRWQEVYYNTSRQTAKSIRGIKSSSTFTDTITSGERIAPDGEGAAPDLGSAYDYGNTGAKYTASEDSAVKFYIDSQGYLRCFFGSNTNNWAASYVYEKNDGDAVKTEALQRALGAFTTMLEEASPESKVSAVRFSMDTNYHYYVTLRNNSEKNRFLNYNESTHIGDLDKLVLLDWTSDSGESTNIMSLERGGSDGTISGDTSDNGVVQYNYGLTGDTFTWTGLQAFINNLADSDAVKDDKASKYLIIFTDGLDSEISRLLSNGNKANGLKAMELDAAIKASKAYELANELKTTYGYTIYTVMLTGGPVSYSEDADSQYYKAKQFLLALSGTDDTNENKSEYFYATDPIELGIDATAGTSKVDMLIQIFANDLLTKFTDSLNYYTVEDAIDPRFDLVAGIVGETPDPEDPGKTITKASDADYVIRLNASGNISIVTPSADGDTSKDKVHVTFNLKNGGTLSAKDPDDPTLTWKIGGSDGDYYLTVNISDKSGESAQTPRLHYNSANDMYYLEWVDQAIPGCTIGAEKLSIWHARITVKAKDDFIGGNSILTNGNLEKMNWVYCPKDIDSSSGTDDMYREYDSDDTDKLTDAYPSKGFPRTTVNVKLLELLIENREQYIYLSEYITPDKFVEKLGDTIKETYYWEYLDRYFKTSGAKYTSLEGFIKALVESNNGIDLPYSYLLNTDGTNQTGQTQPGDVIGVLHYQWDMVDPNDSILGAAGVLNENSYGGTNRLSKSDKFQTLDTRTVKYRLTVSYYPYPDPDDPLWIEADDFTDSLTELDNYISALKDDLSDIEGVIEALKAAKDDMAELAFKNARGELTAAEYNTKLSDIKQDLKSRLDKLTKALNATEDESLPKHIESLKESIDTLQENPDIPDELNSILKSLANDLNALATAAEALNEAIAAVDSNGAASLEEIYSKLSAFITAADGLESPKNAFVEDANDCEAFIEYIRWCVEDSEGNSHLTARDTENAELITEEDYGPVNGNFPKAAVGSSQYEKTVYGSHTTEIVRGELSFELELGMSDMNYQFGWHWSGKEEITYTVDVTREGTAEWHEELPELTITITKEDLAKLKVRADSNNGIGIIYYFDVEDYDELKDFGLKSQYPKAIYDSRTGKVTYYSDPRVFTEASDNDYATLLPKGTYTLTPSSKNVSDWYMFDIEFGYAAIVDYASSEGHFKDEGITSKDSVYSPRISTGSNTENNYAPRDTENDGFEIAEAAKFYLGTGEYADGETYLNARVGMAKVTGTMRYELPATGGEGTTRFLIWGFALLLIGMALAAWMLLSRNYPRFRRAVRFK